MGATGGRRMSIGLILSYVFDWIIIMYVFSAIKPVSSELIYHQSHRRRWCSLHPHHSQSSSILPGGSEHLLPTRQGYCLHRSPSRRIFDRTRHHHLLHRHDLRSRSYRYRLRESSDLAAQALGMEHRLDGPCAFMRDGLHDHRRHEGPVWEGET